MPTCRDCGRDWISFRFELRRPYSGRNRCALRRAGSARIGRESVFERAIADVAAQAPSANDLVDLALTSERDEILHAKMLRLELPNVKADLERGLITFAPNCAPVA